MNLKGQCGDFRQRSADYQGPDRRDPARHYLDNAVNNCVAVRQRRKRAIHRSVPRQSSDALLLERNNIYFDPPQIACRTFGLTQAAPHCKNLVGGEADCVGLTCSLCRQTVRCDPCCHGGGRVCEVNWGSLPQFC